MGGELRETRPRWRTHLATCLAAVVALAFLGVLNLPGQLVVTTNQTKYGGGLYGQRFQHGWPRVYLERERSLALTGPTPDPTQRELWLPSAAFIQVRWSALIANILIALVIALCLAALVEWRARATRRLCQVSLAELLILMAVVGPICGWIHYQRQAWRREQAALDKLANARFETTLGGPTWLRLLVGARWFAWLDRVNDLSSRDANMAAISQFGRLKTLRLSGEVPEGDLALMGRCHGLESLVLTGYDPQTAPGERTRRMRALFEGVSRIRTLRHLEVPYACVDNECLLPLGSLSRLTSLDLSGADLDDAGLEQIGRLRGLESLDLSWAAIDGSGLHHLQGLTQLKWLAILQKGVPPDSFVQAVSELQRARPKAVIRY
jgi:hypothetical protein